MAYVMALDAGTTSCRAMVFDREGRVRGVAQRELEQHFPQPGWVEHDAEEIWTAQAGVMVEAAARARVSAGEIAAVGITNQRETTVVWDRKTGLPIARAIVWQDRRTAPACARMRSDGLEEMVREKTGLVIDSYFSATKLAWILDHVEGARARAERGELAFGTVESWLVWKLSGGACHVTDATNASRTMLYNIHSGEWDDELLRVMRVPRAVLPGVRGCSEVYASVRSNLLASAEVPIAGMAGDQQSALFGQLCLSPGRTKTTYGTGCFTLMNMGESAAVSRHRLLTTVAARVRGRTSYALEGSVFMGGAIVQWLRDGLGLIRESKEIGPLAGSVGDTGGVCLVPAFTGLGAPHWNAGARGMLIGMTRGTTRAHVARAALEAIAHQVADVVEAMEADSGLRLEEMRVDGGASRDDVLLQIQADLLGAGLVRPKQVETTALGAAYLAGLAVGVWRDTVELEAADHIDRAFEPGEGAKHRDEMRDRWRRALERSKDWERSPEAPA